jgi:hypothetical protein
MAKTIKVKTPDQLVDYVMRGLGWQWHENGACLTVYTDRGPIRVFVPLPNLWAIFDAELHKVGLGEPPTVGAYSVGGLFDRVHRAAGGRRRSVGFSNWWGPASIPDLLKHLARSGPFMWPGDPPMQVAGGTGEYTMDLGTWLKIHPFSRPDLWNRLTQADRDALLARWDYPTLMSKHPPSNNFFTKAARAATSTVANAANAVTRAVNTVKKTAEGVAQHALRAVDKNLGFIPGVRQATGLARQGIRLQNTVDRFAKKAARNPYVQAAVSAVLPPAAAGFAAINAVEALKRGNPLGFASIIPGAAPFVNAAQAGLNVYQGVRRGNPLAALSAVSGLPGVPSLPRVPGVPRSFAPLGQLGDMRRAWGQGQHAALQTLYGRNAMPNAAQRRNLAAMQAAKNARATVVRGLSQGFF